MIAIAVPAFLDPNSLEKKLEDLDVPHGLWQCIAPSVQPVPPK
jgi:hypothetical protein